jgi:hypothetical protein
MHAVPSPTTKVVTSWWQLNIICKRTPPLLQITYVKEHLLFYISHMTQYDHDAWTYNNDPDNAQLQHNKCKSTPPLLQITNVKVHLQLHWLSQQQLHYQVYMSTHSTNHNSIRVIIMNQHNNHHNNHHNYQPTSTSSSLIDIYVFINNITINQHICINQRQLYHIVQQLHTISHNSINGENTTHYDKHHIQSSTYHQLII